jgi:hypothetical protein
VVTSTKSSGSSGNIELFVAKDEDNGQILFTKIIQLSYILKRKT